MLADAFIQGTAERKVYSKFEGNGSKDAINTTARMHMQMHILQQNSKRVLGTRMGAHFMVTCLDLTGGHLHG